MDLRADPPYDKEIARIAERYALDTYPNQIEVITAEQMMDAYASVGMPIGYHHWSYGKHFLATEKGYKRGQMGLAYEIVINSDPCIAYLMEENTMCMQALVIAHACYGHNSFFKGNYLFHTWTDASSIIDYLVLRQAVHQPVRGAPRHRRGGRPARLLPRPDELRRRPLQAPLPDLRRGGAAPPEGAARNTCRRRSTTSGAPFPRAPARSHGGDSKRFPAEPQENILYFIEKHAPLLEPWQREVVRIVRKIAQYFYPQRQTQVMNEGWATFWHYTLLNDLYDEGLVTDGFMMEFLPVRTPAWSTSRPSTAPTTAASTPTPWASPCTATSAASARTPPRRTAAGSPTSPAATGWPPCKFAMQNFKDESFILQFLSPKVIRDFRLFSILDDDQKDELLVDAIHDEQRLPAASARPWRRSTTWATASPTCRSGTSTAAATAR